MSDNDAMLGDGAYRTLTNQEADAKLQASELRAMWHYPFTVGDCFYDSISYLTRTQPPKRHLT